RVHLGQPTSVVARHGDLYGTLVCSSNRPEPPGGNRLELFADRTLRVRVVDPSEQPVGDVPLHVVWREGDETHYTAWAETTGADGIAAFGHMQTWRPAFPEEPTPLHAEWRVEWHVPGDQQPGLVFDPLSPPAEPLVVRLPAFGRVQVRVDLRGR